MSQRGALGSPREACSCIWPSVCRNTRSTPSTRSCSSCYGGARSSTACSARSCTASSDAPPGLLRLPPRTLPPPPSPPHCLRASASAAGPGNVLWRIGEIIKPWCVYVVGFVLGSLPPPPVLPSQQSRCGGRTSLAAGRSGASDLQLPLGLLGEALTFRAPGS